MGHRLFVAAYLDSTAAAELRMFVDPRREVDRRLRWAPEERWHLTTAFFSSAPDRTLESLADDLAAAVAGVPAFRCALSGGGCFGPPTGAKVLWLGVEPGAEELARLSRRTRNAGNRNGAAADGAAFQPHLTLARSGRPFDARRWLPLVDGYRGTAWTVDELWLMESHLGAGSVRHEPLQRLPLAPGRPA